MFQLLSMYLSMNCVRLGCQWSWIAWLKSQAINKTKREEISNILGLTRLSRKPVNPEELPAQATMVCPISSLKSTFDTRRTSVRLVSSLDFASNMGKRVSTNKYEIYSWQKN